MSYLRCLKTMRWIKTKDCHVIKLGTSGMNGACVKPLHAAEQESIEKWLATKAGLQETGLWWSFERYTQTDDDGDPTKDWMWHAGYEFKMSTELYQKVCTLAY